MAANGDQEDPGSRRRGEVIGIITDSTCDIPAALLKQYGISVVPTVVIWGDRQYRDRVDLQPEEFYERLAVDPERPTSSTPSLPDFQDAYRRAIAQGAEALIVLTVSSAMSGVYQMAVNAAKLEKVPVTVVDSKGPTMSLGWQVLAAARARDAGAALPAIVECVDNVRKQLMQLVYMDSLEHLEKGGRIGQAVKWMGVALQVRPVVSINHQSGLVEPVGLARTRKAGVEMLFSKFAGFMEGKTRQHVAVLHGNAPEDCDALAERVRSQLHPDELLINMTGPVLGIHTGPRALALCGYGETVR
jgi:DegV family protein with EDD domain